MKELSIEEKAKTEKQRVLLTETNGSANIDWDCRSLDDVKTLLKCGLEFIRTIEDAKNDDVLAADNILRRGIYELASGSETIETTCQRASHASVVTRSGQESPNL